MDNPKNPDQNIPEFLLLLLMALGIEIKNTGLADESLTVNSRELLSLLIKQGESLPKSLAKLVAALKTLKGEDSSRWQQKVSEKKAHVKDAQRAIKEFGIKNAAFLANLQQLLQMLAKNKSSAKAVGGKKKKK